MSDEPKPESLPRLFDACQWALAHLTNANTIDALSLVYKLVDALNAAGLDRSDLDNAAMAAMGGKPEGTK